MKTKSIKPRALYWASFNRFEFRIQGQAILDIARGGSNDAEVERWTPKVRAQADKDGFKNCPTDAAINEELREYGAWDSTERQDTDANWQRLVWIACHNIAESESPDCSKPIK